MRCDGARGGKNFKSFYGTSCAQEITFPVNNLKKSWTAEKRAAKLEK